MAGLEAARKTTILFEADGYRDGDDHRNGPFRRGDCGVQELIFSPCGPSGAWTSSAVCAIISARMRTVSSMLSSLTIETGSRRQNWSSTKLWTRTKCVMRLCSLMPHSHPPRQLVWESLHLPEGEEGSWCCGLDCGRGKGDEVWEAVQSLTIFCERSRKQRGEQHHPKWGGKAGTPRIILLSGAAFTPPPIHPLGGAAFSFPVCRFFFVVIFHVKIPQNRNK